MIESNFCPYSKEDRNIAHAEGICYLENYPTISDDDNDEVSPNFVVENSLELFYDGCQFEDVVMNLIPEMVDFQISTTDVVVRYTERNETLIQVETLNIENFVKREKYTKVDIILNTVAELKCSSLNFHEAFYKDYEIFDVSEGSDDFKFWKENGYHPDSGFYQVDKSEWLRESKSKYDPQDSLGLKHFLVTGNDSYIEVLAKGYTIR